jgi:hypothetical protein
MHHANVVRQSKRSEESGSRLWLPLRSDPDGVEVERSKSLLQDNAKMR